jgi:hypothetical protein
VRNSDSPAWKGWEQETEKVERRRRDTPNDKFVAPCPSSLAHFLIAAMIFALDTFPLNKKATRGWLDFENTELSQIMTFNSG